MNAQYWRVYYKIQELLANEFMNDYEKGSNGGVRSQSTLPPKLNETAHGIARSIIDMHKKEINYTIVVTIKEVYDQYLNELESDLRCFVDENVIADYYFLAMDIDNEKILGGFVVRTNGCIGGLFSLEKGLGKELLSKQIAITKANMTKDNFRIKIDCIGEYLKSFYEKQGFYVVAYNRWNERLAPKNWNGKRFGFPNIYFMVKDL